MKKIITSFASLAMLTLVSCSSQTNSVNDEVKTESVEVQTVEPEEEQEIETQPAVYCHTCGSEISGSPYEAFGRIYCDMQCYADDPTN